MGITDEPHWLEEAERILESARIARMRRKSYDVSTVGARIRTAREVVGLTQPQLARRVGAHDWTISNAETGHRNLPATLLQGLSRALGVSVAWLLMESDDGGPPVPTGILRKQKRVNWTALSARKKAKHAAKVELERLRGLRPKKP